MRALWSAEGLGGHTRDRRSQIKGDGRLEPFVLLSSMRTPPSLKLESIQEKLLHTVDYVDQHWQSWRTILQTLIYM